MLIKVNNRLQFFTHLQSVTKVKPGLFEATRYGVAYRIEGGRHAGGRKTEWFVDTPSWGKAIVCKSVLDSLRMIDGM